MVAGSLDETFLSLKEERWRKWVMGRLDQEHQMLTNIGACSPLPDTCSDPFLPTRVYLIEVPQRPPPKNSIASL